MGVGAGEHNNIRCHNNNRALIDNNNIFNITDSNYSFELQFNQLIY